MSLLLATGWSASRLKIFGDTLTARFAEPQYRGRSLSQWLLDWDTNLRFPDDVPPRSGFTDEQIDAALDAIGTNAFPHLMNWLTAQDSPLKERANGLLNKQCWIQFRFASASKRQCLAERGFQYFAKDARSLQPALIELTKKRNREVRLAAYEAFFFTRPEDEVFLPVYRRALKEAGVRAMARQWLRSGSGNIREWTESGSMMRTRNSVTRISRIHTNLCGNPKSEIKRDRRDANADASEFERPQ